MVAVDMFFRFNKNIFEEYRDDGAQSMFCRMWLDEFDDIYGISDADWTESGERSFRNYVRNHSDEITVLRECPCRNVAKIRHHPDYSKPLEIELLCRKCHRYAHRGTSGKYFNKLNHFSHKYSG